MQGVNTPHIVLNYLDYLLWTKRSDAKYKGLNFDEFSFEFRNSVEHWYPQHPSKDMLKSWDDKDGDHLCRDYIGNICIISREVNSKFSNLAPTSKKHYKDIVQKGSLKLRKMGEETTDDTLWRTTGFKKHGEEMLTLLKENCQNIT